MTSTSDSAALDPRHLVDLTGTIATLGDSQRSITCSQTVAKESYPTFARVGARTFEEAASMVKDGHVELFLVPGAYPDIAKFLMDEDLVLEKAFKTKIPALVFGNVANKATAPLDIIYHHPAVGSLLPKVPGYNAKIRFVASRSNEAAYESMMDCGERAGCVSNQIVFDYFNRPSLCTLRTERDMSWHVFARRRVENVDDA
jgi:hypothetical protein